MKLNANIIVATPARTMRVLSKDISSFNAGGCAGPIKKMIMSNMNNQLPFPSKDMAASRAMAAKLA